MQRVPSFYLRRPPLALDRSQSAACDALLDEAFRRPGRDLTARLPVEPWKFCSYIAETHPVLLHGSQHQSVAAFTPRRSYDGNPFGNRSAVFAASDGIWPMFFALLKRDGVRTLSNTCFRVVMPDGQRSAPYYFFSITKEALAREPWSEGTMYILPRETFEQHPPETMEGVTVEMMEWASEQTIEPVGFLHIRPADFPFLAQVRGHDEEFIREQAATNPEGWPWADQ